MIPRRCATPAALKATLEQRLRSRAVGDGLELQRTRQLVVCDRFLAWVFAEHEDAVVLKGGLALELARTTKDVDLRLEEVGKLLLADLVQSWPRPQPLDEVDQLLEQIIGRAEHARIGLIGPLSGDHVDELIFQLHVAALHRVAEDLPPAASASRADCRLS